MRQAYNRCSKNALPSQDFFGSNGAGGSSHGGVHNGHELQVNALRTHKILRYNGINKLTEEHGCHMRGN